MPENEVGVIQVIVSIREHVQKGAEYILNSVEKTNKICQDYDRLKTDKRKIRDTI